MKYLNVPIPEGKEPEKYNFVERRAEILRIIIEAGHQKAITQTQLAKRYGKSQEMIHKDIEAIKHEIMDLMNKDAEFTIYTLFNKVIRKGAASSNLKDNYLAAHAAKSWYEWLQGIGAKPKVSAINQANFIGQVNQFQFNTDAPFKEQWHLMEQAIKQKQSLNSMQIYNSPEEAISHFLVENGHIDPESNLSFNEQLEKRKQLHDANN